MKINGNVANSINFIEQKKSNTSLSNTKEKLNEDYGDKFLGKEITPNHVLESNESLGILQVAHESILKLKNDNNELQKLSEKFFYFKSEEYELTTKFEQIAEGMLDVIDNTIFKETQIFYSNLEFSVGERNFDISLSNEHNIEDFNIRTTDELITFENNLNILEEEILNIKNYVEVASFNKIASLNSDSSLLEKIAPEKMSPSVEEIKGAHDINSLKDKISSLLED